MKRKLSFTTCLLIFSLMSQFGCTQDIWSDKARVLPDELRQIPEAIFIRHSPNPNFPERTTDVDQNESTYVWKHSTSVMSVDQDLKVIKVGSYIWYDESGWKRNVEYNRKDAIKRFGCPKGIMEKGVSYTFEKNYRWGNQLYGGDALWYVLAKDDQGNIYKGMGLIETEATLKSN